MSKSKLHQITERVYWFSPDHTTDRPTLGAVVGENGTLIVDAGNSPAHASLFLDELAKIGVAPPTYLVLTHWHWDHVFGTAVFDTPIIASQETAQTVATMSGWDWSDVALDKRVEEGVEIPFCRDMIKAELPDRSSLHLKTVDITFTQRLEIDLGTVTCQIVHVGGDHASDSAIVYIPQDNIVFLSDCLYPDLYNGTRYTPQKLFPLLNTILAFKADYYLHGHEDKPRSLAEMEAQASLLKMIGQTVAHHGPSRDRILARVSETLGVPLDEEQLEIVDAFLVGL